MAIHPPCVRTSKRTLPTAGSSSVVAGYCRLQLHLLLVDGGWSMVDRPWMPAPLGTALETRAETLE